MSDDDEYALTITVRTGWHYRDDQERHRNATMATNLSAITKR